MTPSDRQQVDRVLAVVANLKDATRALETMHEIDAARAISFFERAPPAAGTHRSRTISRLIEEALTAEKKSPRSS